MEPPLRLACRLVGLREYVVLQLGLETGAVGTGYVLTRGQRIRAAAEDLAEQIVGKSLADLCAVESRERGSSTHQRARAIGHQCAWDLLGQLRGVPTWRLFGEASESQPILLVAG